MDAVFAEALRAFGGRDTVANVSDSSTVGCLVTITEFSVRAILRDAVAAQSRCAFGARATVACIAFGAFRAGVVLNVLGFSARGRRFAVADVV